MPISANVTNEQISVAVGETQIDVAVTGGVGPTGSSGTVAVSAPLTNAGTTTAANLGLSVGTGLAVSGGSLVVSYGTGSTVACRGDDARLSDSREWSADTVSQAEAEAGSSTTRRAFTPQRVFQAIAAWWASSSAKTKLDGIANNATANATDAQLRDRSTHTGTQTASTISDFTSAVIAAAPPTTNASLLTSGTLADARLSGNVVLTNDARLSDARTPLSHTHTASQISDFTTAVIAAAPPTTNASLLTSGTLPDARLSSNIARTSDVSSAVAAVVGAAPESLNTLQELSAALANDASFSATVTNSLASKAPIASPTFTGTVSGITKAMVGLGNVDNTSDASKPVSTAQAAADAAVASAAASDATTKANAAQAAAVQRANHTGTQAWSTITGTPTTLSGYGITNAATSVQFEDLAVNLQAYTESLSMVAFTGSASDLEAGTVPFARLPVGTTSTTVAVGNDSRFTDARTPTAHKSTHATGGTDALTPADIGAAALSHTHSALTDITGLATIATSGSASDLSAGTVPFARLPVGQTSTTVAAGNDARFTDARTPLDHVHSGADITTGTVATARLGSGTANSTTFLRGDGTWAAAGSSSASDLTSGTLADARLSANARQAIDNLFHPFLLAGM